MQPELEDTEAAVRRLLPDKTEINNNDLKESESVEFYRGMVLYNINPLSLSHTHTQG